MAKRPPSMAKVLLSLFTEDEGDVYAAFLTDGGQTTMASYLAQ